MMYAATLAGIAFGNSRRAPAPRHGLLRSRNSPGLPAQGYPGDKPICAHGISGLLNARAVFRHMAPADSARHRVAAGFKGAGLRGAGSEDAGEVLAGRVVAMTRDARMANGLGDLGYGEADIPRLTEGARARQRLLANPPVELPPEALADLYRSAGCYR